MRIIKTDVSLLHQGPGIDGMFKMIELTGRVAYKSEDRITEDSAEKFVKMIYKRGHHQVLEQGTVYLKVPALLPLSAEGFFKKMSLEENLKKWIAIRIHRLSDGTKLITTNYRLICQLEEENFMREFWCEPEENHYRRQGVIWTCSRVIAQEILRHRVFSPVMESTRYVNYGKEKHGGIGIIMPQWIYTLRDEYSKYEDTFTGRTFEYLKDLDGQELWTELTTLDRTVASRDDIYRMCEDQYLFELKTEESWKNKPEDARGVLNLDLKAEVCTTAFLDDWYYTAPECSPEKAGVFNLRVANDAHPDVRVLAKMAAKLFKEEGLDNLK